MRVLIDDTIVLIKSAQFMDDYICLIPADINSYLFKVSYDAKHDRETITKALLKDGYLTIDWTEPEKEWM